jgi:pyrroloquinoline quinone biosynthesis protein D
MSHSDETQLKQIPKLANGYRLQWEPAQDSFVVLYPEGMKVLSGSAGEIVQQCNGENDVATIIANLEEKFPNVELSGDVLDFIAGASAEGWLNV